MNPMPSVSSMTLPYALSLLLVGAVASCAWGGSLAGRGSWLLLAVGVALGGIAIVAILLGGIHANGRLHEIRGTCAR